jgi:HEAT repeat protein
MAFSAPRAQAYIDVSPTLGRIILESANIALVRVDKTHREKRIVIYKKVADLRGTLPDTPIKHQLTDGHPPREPRHILDWATPGQPAVVFSYRGTMLVCTGPCWYEVHRATAPARGVDTDEDGLVPWWRMSLDRPELALVYCGSPNRLAKHVKDILENKKVIVTTVAHGAQGRGAFSECVFNDMQAGALPPLQRLYASLNMPRTVYDIDTGSPWFVGLGAISESEIPQAIQGLEAAEPPDRLDALGDLASLGRSAKSALPVIRKLLTDTDPTIRLQAATAIALIDPASQHAIDVLIAALADASPIIRRTAAQCLARLGPPAAAALDPLLRLVTAPDPDANVRAAAIDAIGRLGTAAKNAIPQLIKLLEDPGLRCAAAESLGRIGPGAGAALPALTKALSDSDATWQWTAARAMVLIGGDGARPVVPFLVQKTARAPRSRELYQLTWLLGLLGPVANDAIPTLHHAQNRDNELAAMAIWAVAPQEQYPWQIGYHWNRPCDQWLFADYIDRMGDRATPAAATLASRILDGTAGRVPPWGYHLLKARPQAALPILKKGLEHEDARVRHRAQIALSAM